MNGCVQWGMTLNKRANLLNATELSECDVAFIQHVGWLRHDRGEEVVRLLQQGHFEASEQAFFWLYLRAGDTVIDCGSHIGLFSILASRATSDNARVVAVEANPHTVQHLKFNLKSNGVAKPIVIDAAIWNTSGKINFLDSKDGGAAYDHVDYGNDRVGLSIASITLDQLVRKLGGGCVALVKIDIEGAETEAVIGASDAIAAGLFPVIMVEFTESILQSRGHDSNQLYKQLVDFGYTLCEFNPEKLQLEPYRPDGPIWYKNLFACKDLKQTNIRLETASVANRTIALDVLARGVACSQFKALEDLDRFKQMAEHSEYLREWAERTEQFLIQERATSKQLKEWAEGAEARAAAEQKKASQAHEILNSRKKLLLRFLSRNLYND